MTKPAISIILPVYNEEAFITEALQSLVLQKEQRFEAVIVDDGSTDGTAGKIKPFLSDERFTFLQPGKLGKNKAINLAFQHTRADWLTFFCGDDVLPPDSLHYKLHYTEGIDPTTTEAIGFSRVLLISNDPTFHGMELPKRKDTGSDSGSAMIFSRALTKNIFPLPEILPNEDQWTALCGRYFAKKSFHIPHVCWHYRIHDNNSHRRDADFETYSRLYHSRFQVYNLFLNTYRKDLEKNDAEELRAYANLEQARWEQDYMGIIKEKVPMFEKIRAMIYSTSLLYRIRQRFYRFFSGW